MCIENSCNSSVKSQLLQCRVTPYLIQDLELGQPETEEATSLLWVSALTTATLGIFQSYSHLASNLGMDRSHFEDNSPEWPRDSGSADVKVWLIIEGEHKLRNM